MITPEMLNAAGLLVAKQQAENRSNFQRDYQKAMNHSDQHLRNEIAALRMELNEMREAIARLTPSTPKGDGVSDIAIAQHNVQTIHDALKQAALSAERRLPQYTLGEPDPAVTAMDKYMAQHAAYEQAALDEHLYPTAIGTSVATDPAVTAMHKKWTHAALLTE